MFTFSLRKSVVKPSPHPPSQINSEICKSSQTNITRTSENSLIDVQCIDMDSQNSENNMKRIVLS